MTLDRTKFGELKNLLDTYKKNPNNENREAFRMHYTSLTGDMKQHLAVQSLLKQYRAIGELIRRQKLKRPIQRHRKRRMRRHR